ncbi:MAG: DUF222 domain-containing protein [Actinomycetota bacterium]
MFAGAGTTELEEATERLSGLLSALDVGLVPASSLPDLVALGERIERLGHALKTSAAAAVAGSSVWRAAGVRSAEEWLAQRTGSSKTEAARLVETGRQLQQLPATAAAVRRGDLSARQAQAIAGAATADPDAEDRLLAAASHSSLRELQDECARTRANAEPDPEAAARRAHRARSYRSWADPDGVTGHIHLSGPTASIARIDNAIRHRADKIFRAAHAEGRREPSEAYAYDAALELITNSEGGDSKPVPAGADAKIIVRIDHTALVRGHSVAGETCEIAGIGPVPVSTVREWMDDAFLAAVLTRGEDVQRVVHLGRRFTTTQRTALQWRDPICARKGCNNRLGLEYDHFEDWAHTHTTRTTAAKRFCRPCHQLKTNGWHVSPPDTNGKCTFTPPGPAPNQDTIAAAAAEAITAQHRRQHQRRATRAQQQQLLDTG